jgi:hypothetical protein
LLELEPRPAQSGPARHVRSVGRLVEIRIARLVNVADVATVQADIVRAMGPSTMADRWVCADLRGTPAVSPDVIDAWTRCMREVNHRIARGAVLVDPANAMFSLQAERALRCAGNSERHLFQRVEDVLAWLDEGLTEIERAELRAFLAHGGW